MHLNVFNFIQLIAQPTYVLCSRVIFIIQVYSMRNGHLKYSIQQGYTPYFRWLSLQQLIILTVIFTSMCCQFQYQQLPNFGKHHPPAGQSGSERCWLRSTSHWPQQEELIIMKELFSGMITAFDGSKQVALQYEACWNRSKQPIWIIIECSQFLYFEHVLRNSNEHPGEWKVISYQGSASGVVNRTAWLLSYY